MRPEPPEPPDENDPQWQRAHQAWALVVDVDASTLSEEDRRQLFRVLRVKRMERPDLLQRLPGDVRRGARVDLETAQQSLSEHGIPCRLIRRADR